MSAESEAINPTPEMKQGTGRRAAKGAGLVALGLGAGAAVEHYGVHGDDHPVAVEQAAAAPAQEHGQQAHNNQAEHGGHQGAITAENILSMDGHHLMEAANDWTPFQTKQVAETISQMNDAEVSKLISNVDIDRTHSDFGQHLTGLEKDQTLMMILVGSAASPDNAAANKAQFTGHDEVLIHNPASLSNVDKGSEQHINDIRAVAEELANVKRINMHTSLAGEQVANYGVINGQIDYAVETLSGEEAKSTTFVTDNGQKVEYKDSCGNVEVVLPSGGVSAVPAPEAPAPGGGAAPTVDQPGPGGGAPPTVDQPPETPPPVTPPETPPGEHPPQGPLPPGGGEPPDNGIPLPDNQNPPPPGGSTPDSGGGLGEQPPGSGGDGTVTPPPEGPPAPAPDVPGGHPEDF